MYTNNHPNRPTLNGNVQFCSLSTINQLLLEDIWHGRDKASSYLQPADYHTGHHSPSLSIAQLVVQERNLLPWSPAVLTFLMETSRQLLSLLKVWTREHLQNFLDAAPAGPGQHLGQTDAERSITTVHIGDVIGVLEEDDTYTSWVSVQTILHTNPTLTVGEKKYAREFW